MSILDKIDKKLNEGQADIDYYKGELDKVGDKRVTVKFYGDKGESKNLNVNKNSIPLIVSFLKKLK